MIQFLQTTLILNVLPESKLLARNAAYTIFSLETLRILVIRTTGSYSEEFYTPIAEVSSSSKVRLYFIFWLAKALKILHW